jgi:hypothetical protein
MKAFTVTAIIMASACEYVAGEYDGDDFYDCSTVADEFSCVGEDREQYDYAVGELELLPRVARKAINVVRDDIVDNVQVSLYKSDIEAFQAIRDHLYKEEKAKPRNMPCNKCAECPVRMAAS